MQQEFITKMTEAIKLEKEALISLLPERARGHVDIIAGEIRAILKECVLANLMTCTNDCKKQEDEPHKTQTKTKKVEIL